MPEVKVWGSAREKIDILLGRKEIASRADDRANNNERMKPDEAALEEATERHSLFPPVVVCIDERESGEDKEILHRQTSVGYQMQAITRYIIFRKMKGDDDQRTESA